MARLFSVFILSTEMNQRMQLAKHVAVDQKECEQNSAMNSENHQQSQGDCVLVPK